MRRSIPTLALAALLAAAGCKSGPKEPTTIKLGVFEPMTGANAAGGAMEVEGIKLANELNPTVKVGDKE